MRQYIWSMSDESKKEFFHGHDQISIKVIKVSCSYINFCLVTLYNDPSIAISSITWFSICFGLHFVFPWPKNTQNNHIIFSFRLETLEDKLAHARGGEEDLEMQRLELERYTQEKERDMQELEHQLQLQEISLMNREVQQEEEQEGYYSKLRGEQTRMTGRMQVRFFYLCTWFLE